MIHDAFNFPYWQTFFQDNVIPNLSDYDLLNQRGDMTGPLDLIINERMRAMANMNQDLSSAVATDIFIFAKGESVKREVTKIGGLPYRSASLTWPVLPSGQPATFIAQFCFADSQDIIGPLPGDILLIFTESDEYGLALNWLNEDEFKSQILFEWITLGNFPLVSADMIPRTIWHPFPCFGSIYRNYDFPTFDACSRPDITEYLPTINSATKIGGFPDWMHYEEFLPGRFICELNSTMPYGPGTYPFLNQPEPLSSGWQSEFSNEPDDLCEDLHWGDVGTLYIFLDEDNQIHWTIQTT